MNYDYKYDDPDYLYTDPGTGVLRNKLGIDDGQLLHATEGFETATRLLELEKKPIKIKSAKTLLDIHGYLFQDLYEWAGKVRTVNISKQGKPFFPVTSFVAGFAYIDGLIDKYRDSGADMTALPKQLATILDSVNYLHPFREGNGRTQREFIRVLALEKGHALILNPPDNKEVYEQYMQGTIEGDIKLLTGLIHSIII
jgi:cell filamentation protein